MALVTLPLPLEYVRRDLSVHCQTDQFGHVPPLALYHLIDGVEVIAKFLFSLVAGECEAAIATLTAAGDSTKASAMDEEVRDKLRVGEHPSLGTWISALGHSRAVLDHISSLVLPGLDNLVGAFVTLVMGRTWATGRQLGLSACDIDVVALRNWVVHGAIPTPQVAATVVTESLGAVESFLGEAEMLLADVVLAYVAGTPGSNVTIAIEVTLDETPSADLTGLAGYPPGLYAGSPVGKGGGSTSGLSSAIPPRGRGSSIKPEIS